MNAADIIRAKRDGNALEADSIRALIEGVASGTVGDEQLGAFLMAVYLQGMTAREQAALTLAMRDSGEVLQWTGLDGPVLDKHSTGGVGDLVSLVLAPLLAACGAYVPMISGRGLGHTGGTLDKLESIPGLTVNLDTQSFDSIVRSAGFAMAGQGDALAPADRRLYAARDVTATVSSRPLIVSSILSKKLCAGLEGLVMDVKVGNGAIFRTVEESRTLAQAICDVANEAGLPCSALLTDMNQPLASSAGNALEMAEAIGILMGDSTNHRLLEVIIALCVELLVIGGLENDPSKARALLQENLTNGQAAERFGRMVSLQGGPVDFMERPDHYLAQAPVQQVWSAPHSGYIGHMNTREIGRVVHALGGGRDRASDTIDPSVGLVLLRPLGSRVAKGDALIEIHAASQTEAQRAASRLELAMGIEERQSKPPDTIHARVGKRSETDPED